MLRGIKDHVRCVLFWVFQFFLFIYLAVEAVGTVGNSTFFVEFSKRVGTVEKRGLFFHGFHSAAVSTARSFAPLVYSPHSRSINFILRFENGSH
jgi:hypothetical protein